MASDTIPTTTIDAWDLTHWEAPHLVRDAGKVEAIAASMDSNPEEWVWDGAPLVVDVEARQLYTGVHRQAALRHLGEDVTGWQIPVVDVWDLVSREAVEARRAGDDTLDLVDAIDAELHDRYDAALIDELGWQWR